MRRYRKSANPFYILLVIAGVTFALTAFGYGLMVYRQTTPPRTPAEAASGVEPHPFMDWMQRNGDAALVVELAALAICTIGAIGTDNYWQRRAADNKQSH